MERSRLSDVSATLLNVGLLNVCDEDESLRGAAYDLLFAVCAYVNYEANPLVPLRGTRKRTSGNGSSDKILPYRTIHTVKYCGLHPSLQ